MDQEQNCFYSNNSNSDKMAVRSLRSRNWIITINNPEESELQLMTRLDLLELSYVFQLERGLVNEIEHFRLFVNTPTVKSRAWMITNVFPRGHIEIARNRKAAINYCQVS